MVSFICIRNVKIELYILIELGVRIKLRGQSTLYPILMKSNASTSAEDHTFHAWSTRNFFPESSTINAKEDITLYWHRQVNVREVPYMDKFLQGNQQY